MTGCEWVEGALAGHVAGELSAAAAAWVGLHLVGCPACARAAAEYRAVIRLARSLPPPAPSPEAAALIVAALRAAAGRPAGGSLDETRLDVPLAPV